MTIVSIIEVDSENEIPSSLSISKMYPSRTVAIDKADCDLNNSTKPKCFAASKSKSTTPPISPGKIHHVDDNGNPEENSAHNSNPNSKASNFPMNSHLHIVNPAINEQQNDTPDQQRRRNSSIAKLLGGQPLNNQQYEEINQQILDDQSAHLNHNGENGIQRSRSSITRTLLMNAERKNSVSSSTNKTESSSPTVPVKDFEYLIRQELDNDHSVAHLQRNGSNSNVFKSLNTSNQNNIETIPQPRFKRKRSISRPTNNLLQNAVAAPFAIQQPFELDASNAQTVNNIPSKMRLHQDQNDLIRFNPTNHHSYQNHPKFTHLANHLPRHIGYQKINPNIAAYTQFSQLQSRSTENQRSASFSFVPYPSATKYSMNPIPGPTAIEEIQDSESKDNLNKQTKLMSYRPDSQEMPRQRSYSNLSIPSSTASSETCTPLKKRLLTAYRNEHTPTSAL